MMTSADCEAGPTAARSMAPALGRPRRDDDGPSSPSSASGGPAEVRHATVGSSVATGSRTDEPRVDQASASSSSSSLPPFPAPRLVPPGREAPRRAGGGGVTHLQPILPAPAASVRLLAPLAVAPPSSAAGPLLAAAAVATDGPASDEVPRREFGPPAVFLNRRQRSGKWIPEEEAYADALIRLFERGILYDCENGSTLRSYLSRKLHCAPMRISKKYAGRGIGKMLFVCRVRLHLSMLAPYPEEVRMLERQAMAKELLFYKAVFPDMDLPDELPPIISVAAPPVTVQGKLVVPALVPISFPAMLHPQVPLGPIIESLKSKQPSTVVQGVTPATGHGPIQMTPMTAVPLGQPPSGADNLQKSFVNALHQGKGNINRVDSKNVQAQDARGYHTQQQVHVPTLGSAFRSNATVTTVPAPGPANVPDMLLFNGVLPSMSAPMAQLVLTPVPAPSLPNPLTNTRPPGLKETTLNDDLSPVPDFLAGFDRVALAMRTNVPRSADLHASVPGADESSLQYSPPFTSQSFDDLHRFLGEDLVPLEPPAVGPTGGGAASASLHHNYDPVSLVAAPVGSAPVCVLPEGRVRQVTQCRPLSVVAQSYPHGLVPQDQASHRFPVAASDEALEEDVLLNEEEVSHHGSMTSMDCAYGDYGTAMVSDENNDSGQSSANPSCSEQDNATSSREQSDDDDESDDPDWEDNARTAKKMRLDRDLSATLRS